MIYRTPSEKIKEYYETMGINQSALKVILKHGVEAFVRQQEEILRTEEAIYEEKEHFIIGKGVDCLITEGEDAFKQQFHYNELLRKPSEKPMAIVNLVYVNIPEEERASVFGVHRSNIFDAMNTVGYYNNTAKATWQEDDARLDRMLKDGLCQLYWEDLLRARGKQILSKEQHDVINNVHMSLVTHVHTAYLFHPLEYTNGDLDVIYQLALYWKESIHIEGDIIEEDCKCLIDETVINHKKKTISPIDVKTTRGFVSRFNGVVEYRRYDIQGAYYTRGINACKGRIGEIVGRDVSDYVVENFAFVVESTEFVGTPLIFPLTDGLLAVGTVGDIDGDKEGWEQALGKYAIFKKYNFSVAELVKEDMGIVWIDDNFKIELDI